MMSTVRSSWSRPKMSRKALVCSAISRVGQRMSPRRPRPWVSLSASGKPKAPVLPEPVSARPIRSPPSRASGMMAAWIGVGLTKPMELRVVMMAALMPSDSKASSVVSTACCGMAPVNIPSASISPSSSSSRIRSSAGKSSIEKLLAAGATKLSATKAAATSSGCGSGSASKDSAETSGTAKAATRAGISMLEGGVGTRESSASSSSEKVPSEKGTTVLSEKISPDRGGATGSSKSCSG